MRSLRFGGARLAGVLDHTTKVHQPGKVRSIAARVRESVMVVTARHAEASGSLSFSSRVLSFSSRSVNMRSMSSDYPKAINCSNITTAMGIPFVQCQPSIWRVKLSQANLQF